MASFELYGKKLEIPRRNEPLVKRLRELLELAEDAKLLALSYVARDCNDQIDIHVIEDGDLTCAGLGAVDLLTATYRSSLYEQATRGKDGDDDEV